MLLLSVHPSREKDLLTPQRIELSPGIKARQGLDPFGNIWTRFLAPAGRLEIRTDFLLQRQRPAGRGRSRRAAVGSPGSA